MVKVNYKGMAFRELFDSFIKEHPNYSLGEVLYSVLRLEEGSDMPVKDIKNISDNRMYELIYNANKTESEL